MGKYFICWLLCLCGLNALAQDSVIAQPKTIIAGEVGASGIGMAVEWNHGSKFTVETAVTFGPSYVIEDEWLLPLLNVHPNYSSPAIRFSVTPRFYFNKDHRYKERKKKYTHVDFFMGLGYSYVTGSFNEVNGPVHLVSLHWGARQFFSPRGVFTAYAGVGSGTNTRTNFHSIYLSLNVKVGYRFN